MALVEMKKLRETQLLELKLLKKIKEICESENICYYLVGGTALGAVRHRGFIPWDDDIDVAMPRKDYEKFIRVAPKYLDKGQRVLHYSLVRSYFDCSMKLVDTNTSYIMKTNNGIKKQHIWVDIFPIDGSAESSMGNKIHYLRVYFLRMLIAVYNLNTIQFNPSRAKWKRIIIAVAKRIPVKRLINPRRINKRIDRLLTKYPTCKSKRIGNFLGAYQEKELVPNDYFGNGVVWTFEDDQFKIPSKYNLYLTHIYGDYMKLPPKEKQIPRHSVIDIIYK